ncbi:4-(cytidine 5'-diphospho)-2-C-methyl-D-erythritol kinase [Anaerococcus sp. mt242]|uniref:4-(cytidine 5'-diphospho)-2-C-methyl-D-erythritol kinase n=1 Tax=Anaerococcus sp. mt242 TaxID=2661917 RepID=UPI0019326ADF|nr:4-(cytidine 5'-diphospho)-2-C-methyl-D-erythritol kinase [Anaerococcus sp. mt242]MBM0046573.1 4-(cytidine 5'-diphospho)-2-C-methyl-D-erythritol kinase [Anaerococcus sp. mt242]
MNRKCFAKINLTLDSLYKRDDGYHEIDTIMARISLFDELEIIPNDKGVFNYSSNLETICPVEDNLIYKAWEILKEKTENPGVDVYLKKNIPIAAGLAGGSTDAAEMIKGLNELWNLNLSKNEMMEIGKKLGADIPFFFENLPSRAKGIGEILFPFENNLDMKILLVNDGTKISSAEVYKKLADFGHVENDSIVEKLKNGDHSAIFYFENVMEDVVADMYPHLLDLKYEFLDYGAEVTLISGSGASIFGIFMDDESLDIAYEKMNEKYEFVKKVELV